MRLSLLLVIPMAVALASSAHAQTGTRKIVPTIPESQIRAMQIESPYTFLSAATSVDEFMIELGALAEAKGSSEAVKRTAADIVQAHTALMAESMAAGKTDGVEIARPSVDGEQQGILKKLEAMDGEEFEQTCIEALVFGHQRAIAIYRGFAENGNALGAYAAATLPKLVARYGEVVRLAEASGNTSAEPQQAPPAQD